MLFGFVIVVYIIVVIFFIMSLVGFFKYEIVKVGCWYGIVGMVIVLVVIIFGL